MKREDILARINACNQELAQNDYRGRKVAFELAAKFKEMFPSVSLPIYEKYAAEEAIATERRIEINNLEAELENLPEEDENNG